MRRCDFIIGLETAVHCLAHTVKLSKFLQDPKQDLISAFSYIATIIGRLNLMREKADEEFKAIFIASSDTAASMGKEIHLPRICGRQTQRMNVSAKSPEEYYRKVVFLPFVDHLIGQLESRFCDSVHKVTSLERLIPSNFSKFSVDDIIKAAEMYESDCTVTSPELRAEILLWRDNWTKSHPEENERPKNCIDTLVL